MSDRRTFLQQLAAIPFAAPLAAASAKAPQVRGCGEDMPDLVLAYLQKKTNALAAEWDRQITKRTHPLVLVAGGAACSPPNYRTNPIPPLPFCAGGSPDAHSSDSNLEPSTGLNVVILEFR